MRLLSHIIIKISFFFLKFEGVCNVKYVMEIVHQQVAKEKLPVIQMEIDYELLTLHDALKEKNELQINQTKDRLKRLRVQWLQLKNI